MRKVSVIAITATYLDMTFATTASITAAVETGGYFVRTGICTIIWASFPMSHVEDMRGDRMQITIDLLSLAFGFILGIGAMGLISTAFYFDDKWDTAFGYGWKCGREYLEKKEKQDG